MMSQSGQYCSYTFLCISCDLPPQCPLALPANAPPLGLLLSMPDSSQLKRSEGRVEGLSVNLQTTLFIIIISKDYPLFHTNNILYITSLPINSKIDKGKGRNPKKLSSEENKDNNEGKRQRPGEKANKETNHNHLHLDRYVLEIIKKKKSVWRFSDLHRISFIQ